MMKNNIGPLEELRREKEVVRNECSESEERLSTHWEYLTDNAGSLLFHSTLNTVMRGFGFGGTSSPKEPKQQQQDASNSGVIQNIFSGVQAYYPLIWDIVQPMLLRYAVRKIKSIFSGKKKKKRRDDDD